MGNKNDTFRAALFEIQAVIAADSPTLEHNPEILTVDDETYVFPNEAPPLPSC